MPTASRVSDNVTKNFKGGTSPRIYPWNQSKIEDPQERALIRGVNRKSKIENRKSIDQEIGIQAPSF